MRSALLLFLLPGVTATDNLVCAVMSPLIKGMDSVPGLDCSCVSVVGDGSKSESGGDAKCEFGIGPPPVDALADMKVTLHVETTVRPCASPATASVTAAISLPVLTSTDTTCMPIGKGSCTLKTCAGTCETPDDTMDTLFSAAITELNDDAVSYEKSANKIAIEMSVEAGKTKEIEVPIQKWGVADFFAKVGLKVEGNMASLKTTQTVDLCMKTRAKKVLGVGLDAIEICGADIPQCGVEDYPMPDAADLADDPVVTAQAIICEVTSEVNWHKMFGAPPITMFPPQELTFTDACTDPPPPAPAPPTDTRWSPSMVTLAMQASGSISDYSDTSDLKAKVASAAGVNASDIIGITVTAASVIISAVINVPSSTTAAAVTDSLSTKLISADAASAALGITVETIPTVVVYSPASKCSSSPDSGGAVAGGLISVMLFFGTIATVVYLVMKERIANPIDRLKEKLGKKQVHVAPEKHVEQGAAELTAAKSP